MDAPPSTRKHARNALVDHSAATLDIRLFGPFAVRVNGSPIQRVRTRSVEWLLALLALAKGEQVSRSRIAGTLWPDSREEQALTNLRGDLLRLRQALGSESSRVVTPGKAHMRIDLDAAFVDVLEFDRAIHAGDEASLRAAVDLYTGPLLADCDREWVISERGRREQACLNALERLAGTADARGASEEALGFWRRAAQMDPTRDSLQRGLMRALEACGDAPAALLAYRDFRLRLQEEMGIEPDAETVALYRQVQERARRTAAAVGSGGRQSAVGSGHTASGEREAAKADPYGMTSRAKAVIPAPLTALIGREAEVIGIAEAVRKNRLVTLVGAGGIGKTRLSIEVARRLESEFPDGLAFVEVAGLADGTRLAAHVAACLGAREAWEENTEQPEVSCIADSLAGRTMLVVLDNCEHIVEDAAPLVREILERCPLLRILATSRERLLVTGEALWRVPPLAVPGSSETRDHIFTSPSVRLFMERAAMSGSGTHPASDQDARAIARICQRLDGIPLAIELAAARAGVLTLEQIAERLDDRFRLLTGGSRAVLPRHQTLRALVDWSYDLLSPAEQSLLRRLSVFAGGWTLEAAEALTVADVAQVQNPKSKIQNPDALDLLTSLADKSLVQQDEARTAPRWRMLETIREYAREKLDAADEETFARGLHLGYVLSLSERSSLELRGARPDAALDRLEAEIDNIRAAIAWSMEFGVPSSGSCDPRLCTGNSELGAENSELLLRLAAAVWPFWEMRGYIPEGRAHLAAALERAGPEASPTRAQASLGAAVLGLLHGRRDDTVPHARLALADFQATGDITGAATALLHLGHLSLLQFRLPEARALLEESLALGREACWTTGSALALVQLGLVERLAGEEARGDALADEGLRLLETADDAGTPAYCLTYLSTLGPRVVRAGARDLLERMLAILRCIGQRRGVAATLRSLAELAGSQGDSACALAWHREAVEIHRETGNHYGVAFALQDVGNCYYRFGDHAAALLPYRESLELFRKLGYRVGTDTACNNLGSTLFHLGEFGRARELHQEALALYRSSGNLEGIAWSLERLAAVHAAAGEIAEAARVLVEASRARAEFGVERHIWEQADWDGAIATVRGALGEEAFSRLFK